MTFTLKKQALGAILSLLLVFMIGFVSAINTTGVVSYYKLDETSGVVLDTLLTNNGTNNGATRGVEGKINNAFDFEETEGDKVNETIDVDGPFTINTWIMFENDTTTEGQTIYSTRDGTPFMYLAISLNESLEWAARSNANTGLNPQFSGTTLVKDTWYMVSATLSGTSLKLYINGENALNGSYTGGSWSNANTPFIGAFDQASPRNFFDGKIDDIGFWNRSLSIQEISDLYNNGNGLSYPFIQNISVSLTSPSSGATNLLDDENDFQANITSISSNLNNASLYLNGSIAETKTITGLQNLTTFSVSLTRGNYTWIVEACTTSGECFNSSSRSLTLVDAIENSQTFSEEVLTGSLQSFELNASIFGNVTSANFWYNGTSRSASFVDYGPYHIINFNNLTIPEVTSQTNVSFYWQIVTDNTLATTISPRNQTIKVVEVDDCSSYTNVVYNFTIVDEQTQSKITGTSALVDFDFFNAGTTNKVGEFSKNYSDSNSFSVCFSASIDDDLEVYSQIAYSASGYTEEFYYLQADPVTNSNQHENITLYSLINSSSTTFKILYKDSSFLPVSNALIQLQRKYISDGLFKTVEQPITDSNGETVVHVELENIVYTVNVLVEGQVDAVFDNILFKCPNPLIEECEITLSKFESFVDIKDFASVNGLSFTIAYNDTSREISSIFSVLSGSAGAVSLNASLFDAFGNQTICSDLLTSSSGTLRCTVPAAFGNSSAIVDIYLDGKKVGTSIIVLDQKPGETYGASLVFISLIAIMLFIGIGVSGHPAIYSMFLILGLITLGTMSIIFSTGWYGAGATLLWFIIAIIMVLVKGASR